jgi:putative endonuclease
VFYVYILNSPTGVLYTGVTNNLERRVWEHRSRIYKGFTKRYGIYRLAYFEEFQYVEDAIAREKQIKAWRRRKKLELIHSQNPRWQDLAADWYDDH